MIAANQRALADGRDAMIAHRLHGAPAPASPFRAGTVRHRYWQWGTERAARAIDDLYRIGG